MIPGIPYWRLSAVYWGYFAVIGGLSPYWGAYLKGLGLAPQTIGFVAAIPMFTRLLAPYLWGSLADRSGKRLLIAKLGVIGAIVSFIPIFWLESLWTLALATFCFSFFWNAVLPQFEVLTHNYLGERDALYSRIRLWGSVGFIAMVLGLGVWFDYFTVMHLPYGLLIGFVSVLVVLLMMPSSPADPQQAPAKGALWAIYRQRSVWAFFLAVVLIQMSHGVYYGFYTIYMQEHGYSPTLISLLWSFGVVAEIVLFIYVPTIFKRFSLRACLAISMLLAALRWLIVATLPENLTLLTIAQIGHAFSFGLVHAASMAMIRRSFPANVAGRAQALYSALGFGAGAAVGTYVAGWLWLISGQVAFLFAAGLALTGFAITQWVLPRAPIAKPLTE